MGRGDASVRCKAHDVYARNATLNGYRKFTKDPHAHQLASPLFCRMSLRSITKSSLGFFTGMGLFSYSSVWT